LIFCSAVNENDKYFEFLTEVLNTIRKQMEILYFYKGDKAFKLKHWDILEKKTY